MKNLLTKRNFSKTSLTLMTLFFVGCGQAKKQSQNPAEQDSLILALASQNSANTAPAGCLVQLTFSPSKDGQLSRVENVHVIHREGMSAEAMVASQNQTFKRILNPSKENGEESVPEFADEVRRLISQASASGVTTDCLGVAKDLAVQLQERAKAVAEMRAKQASSSGLSFSSNVICDYNCGITPPPINYNTYPYNYPYQYNKYGPTWAGGYGSPDPYTNSFFNNYYGGYGTGDVLYAGTWSSIGNGLKSASGSIQTADTLSSGCKDGMGSLGGCVGGALKAWSADLVKGAAVNGGLLLMGAGRLITPVGVTTAVFDQKAAHGTLSSMCRTGRELECGGYKYSY